MIEAISPLSPLSPSQAEWQAPQVPSADFAALLGSGIDRLDTSMRVADDMMLKVAAGEDVAVHDLMIAMEDARLTLQMASEVRNRLVETYQEMLRMQL